VESASTPALFCFLLGKRGCRFFVFWEDFSLICRGTPQRRHFQIMPCLTAPHHVGPGFIPDLIHSRALGHIGLIQPFRGHLSPGQVFLMKIGNSESSKPHCLIPPMGPSKLKPDSTRAKLQEFPANHVRCSSSVRKLPSFWHKIPFVIGVRSGQMQHKGLRSPGGRRAPIAPGEPK